MTLDDFRQSLAATEPPAGLSFAALWWDRKGDWKRAHNSAQQDEGPEGSWVHAIPPSQRKATTTTPRIGTVGRGSLCADSHSMRNGSTS
jgi:hypothetical protein